VESTAKAPVSGPGTKFLSKLAIFCKLYCGENITIFWQLNVKLYNDARRDGVVLNPANLLDATLISTGHTTYRPRT